MAWHAAGLAHDTISFSFFLLGFSFFLESFLGSFPRPAHASSFLASVWRQAREDV